MLTVSQFRHLVSFVNVPWNISWTHVGSVGFVLVLPVPGPFCNVVLLLLLLLLFCFPLLTGFSAGKYHIFNALTEYLTEENFKIALAVSKYSILFSSRKEKLVNLKTISGVLLKDYSHTIHTL